MVSAKPPFLLSHQLNNEAKPLLNGGSCVSVLGRQFLDSSSDTSMLFSFLDADLRTRDLDVLAPHMWLMTSQSSSNISPLHHQLVKGRKIVITEKPGLHLVWIDDRIFLKPIPIYLLSYAFWTDVLLPGTSAFSKSAVTKDCNKERHDLALAALGFLRSYHHLLQHPTDLDLAIRSRLLPENTTFESFCHFASSFSSILDSDVSPRYSFGELRLTRLNLWSKVFLRRWNYEHIPDQYSQYFQRFYGPLLFAFGCFSVILSALQVEMAVESITDKQWPAFWTFSRVFTIFSLIFIGFCVMGLIFLLLRKLLLELLFALSHQFDCRRRQHNKQKRHAREC